MMEDLFGRALNELEPDQLELLEQFTEIANQKYGAEEKKKREEEHEGSTTFFLNNSFEKEKKGLLESNVELFRLERNSWYLLAQLARDRSNKMESSFPMKEDYHTSDKYAYEKQLEVDSDLRQIFIVVGWLEATAEEETEIFEQEITFGDTQREFQREKRTKEMDPDAFLRGFSLHPNDKEDERRLLKSLWTLIRAGQMEKAAELCRLCNQHWRAATLSPNNLYFDPNLTGESNPMQILEIEGNNFRNLWKLKCKILSQQPEIISYEQAIYSVLSGEIPESLWSSSPKVFNTWEDSLWARYKVLLNSKQNQIFMEYATPYSEDISVADISGRVYDEKDIFESLRKEFKSRGTEYYFRIIQERIILGETERMFKEIRSWLPEKNPVHRLEMNEKERKEFIREMEKRLPNPNLLRFFAHLVLFFYSNGLKDYEEMGESLDNEKTEILLFYWQYLADCTPRQIALVTLYTSKLPKNIQVEFYSHFLKEIQHTKERKGCLLLAEEYNLDVAAITKRVVELIRFDPQGKGRENEMDSEISPEDQTKIQAIEWLCFDTSRSLEALLQANRLAREFIANGRLKAANMLLSVKYTAKIDPSVQNNAADEHNCLKQYLASLNYYNEWFSFDEMDDNETTRNELAKRAKDQIRKTLFGRLEDSSFLEDRNEETDSEDPDRSSQILFLKKRCIPELYYLWHRLCLSLDDPEESLDIINVVADENRRHYSYFSKEQLQRLLELARESCSVFLQTGNDPIGFTIY